MKPVLALPSPVIHIVSVSASGVVRGERQTQLERADSRSTNAVGADEVVTKYWQ